MLQKIKLMNFRNIVECETQLSPRITVIMGKNASGKTNILEAIRLLSTGKSFRAGLEAEMVKHEVEVARVRGGVGDDVLEVVLTRGVVNQKSVAKKRLFVNEVGKRLVDFAGILKTVLFAPQDLELVTSSPGTRRDFLDAVLSQTDYEYRRALLAYEKGMRRRNKLLLRIRDEGAPRTQLTFWNQLLVKHGKYLTKARAEFIHFVNLQKSIEGNTLALEYDQSVISEERVRRYANQEVASGKTLVGPHRDDFIFKIKDSGRGTSAFRELAAYGSRGEQRMAVLWLKMAELAYLEEQTGEKPTLLLDDIFSELDMAHRAEVKKVASSQQTVITTASPGFVKGFAEADKIRL